MRDKRDRNIIGAFALMVADEIVRAAASPAPDAGPTSAALALLDHEPGMSVRTLAGGVGLSHAGAVRLVDRLVADGLVERREHASDGRTRSLHLTPAGLEASAAVLDARDQVISEILSSLDAKEQAILTRLGERVLRAQLRDVSHAYHVCRLCNYANCGDCPIDRELDSPTDHMAANRS
jgi:DNA-binding MarR family transcriptional regulator